MTTANGQTPAPFMQDAPAVISTLGTDAHQGLTSEQAAHNLNQYGPNAFTKPKPESMLSRIVKTAADPMLIMLMIAAAITLGVNITRAMAGGHADILECVGIFFAIALSVTITVVMEGRSAKAFPLPPGLSAPCGRPPLPDLQRPQAPPCHQARAVQGLRQVQAQLPDGGHLR